MEYWGEVRVWVSYKYSPDAESDAPCRYRPHVKRLFIRIRAGRGVDVGEPLDARFQSAKALRRCSMTTTTTSTTTVSTAATFLSAVLATLCCFGDALLLWATAVMH